MTRSAATARSEPESHSGRHPIDKFWISGASQADLYPFRSLLALEPGGDRQIDDTAGLVPAKFIRIAGRHRNTARHDKIADETDPSPSGGRPCMFTFGVDPAAGSPTRHLVLENRP